MRDFCVKCGARFPPLYGEGTCLNWEKCKENQDKYDRLQELKVTMSVIEYPEEMQIIFY